MKIKRNLLGFLISAVTAIIVVIILILLISFLYKDCCICGSGNGCCACPPDPNSELCFHNPEHEDCKIGLEKDKSLGG